MAKTQHYYNSLPECSVVDYELIPYTEGALLWCGVRFDDLSDEVKLTSRISQSIYSHPYIPCLEKKTRMLNRAISEGKLRVVREHGEGGEILTDYLGNIRKDNKGNPMIDHVAYDRRYFWIKDLKAFISEHYPNDRPKTIFHDEELKPIVDLIEYERMSKEYQKLLAENTNLKTDLANAESKTRDSDLALQSMAIQVQQAKMAQKDAEDRLEKGRELYRQLQRQKAVNPDKVADVLKLMSLSFDDLPKKGDKLTASGLNSYLYKLKAKIERETGQELHYSIPDTKTLSNYLNR
ncbi:hypothetical protein PTQ27_05325 [Mannheimia sp. AT1]|uniref:Uncharacterized protein n=1 Tax=Mannheimia cairinae TaxID=3025936 RepID=A0ABT5MPJ6_9PAST|nr:hypothetical protein [Mannheimia cairinae]MDD0823888.1 hypothetical protein [Mannheimia cairinae]MDD0825204.1 hypothetical protein [Mannheimia cairinae]